ncbi:serine/threonine protein kinase [Hyalangium gracile]|uniref:serine/threonine protein kinase n=1 Tax=Hyalangium gracile TaxID=394092 RepID=UPI001CCCCFDC|nr:serine/threonine-protein kinase [Hyalangium gracile]
MVSIEPKQSLALLPPGMGVGPWCVVRRHARGTYGTVYLAERAGHPEAGRFALKMANAPMDPRFARETEVLARIRHPHVPRFEDRGWWTYQEGVVFPYLVMEWVEGVPLYDWASEHSATSRQVMKLLGQVARALEATHAVGCVHRDVKGDNVLVRSVDGTAVLMDFGAGDFLGARTLTDGVLPPGTKRYRSPEALRFEREHESDFHAHYEAGPTDDVYALGVTAYRLATGSYPLPMKSSGLEEDRFTWPEWVPSEEMANLSPELARLIHQLLAKEPSVRGSAARVAEALERAARSAGAEADVRITPHPSRELTEKTEHPGPRPQRSLRRWVWLSGAFGVMALAVRMDGKASRSALERPLESSRESVAQGANDGGTADGGSAGLVDTAFASVSTMPPVRGQVGIGLNMPKNPFPGQRRAPCEKPEVEVNGGCWIILGNETPPCGPRSYEWRNGCYWPSFENPLPATSDPP